MVIAESIGAQIYMLVEVAQIGDGDKIKGKEQLVKAFNFLFAHGRLPSEKPTAEQIKNIFAIRVMRDGDQVMFADPLEVRKFGGLDAGFIFDAGQIKEFGHDNYETGLNRIKAYLEYVYERDGSIANAGLWSTAEPPTSLIELDPGRSEADLEKIAEEDKAKAQTALGRVLSQVEAWEKSQQGQNSSDKQSAHYEGDFS